MFEYGTDRGDAVNGISWYPNVHFKKPELSGLIRNIEPLYTHPVKELHLSLQKSKQTGELLAVTYTDDEHRIVEVLWQRPPVKELTDEEIGDFEYQIIRACGLSTANSDINPIGLRQIIKAILKKAQENG